MEVALLGELAVRGRVEQPPLISVEKRRRIDRRTIERKIADRLPIERKRTRSIEREGSGLERLGQHPGFALCLEDEGIREVPRRLQNRAAFEQLQIAIIDEQIDMPDADAVVESLGKDVKMAVSPQAEGIGAKAVRRHVRKPDER